MDERDASISLYSKLCPATYKPHDWRHATDAPGWHYGDECVRCEACQLKAIYVSYADDGESRES